MVKQGIKSLKKPNNQINDGKAKLSVSTYIHVKNENLQIITSYSLYI